MKLLVIGGTGGTGREIVRQAIEAGHTVTLLARDPKTAETSFPGTRIVGGDVLDQAAVERAMDGQEVVVCSLGSGLSFARMTMLSEGTSRLVAAMTAKGVRRLVCITGVGAGDSRGHGGFVYNWLIRPTILRQVYADKDRQEAVVRGSGLDWIIVRPAVLTDGPVTGRYQALTDLKGVQSDKISRADVADFVLKQITGDRFVGKTPLLTS